LDPIVHNALRLFVIITHESWTEDGLKKDRKCHKNTNNCILFCVFDVINYLFYCEKSRELK
jgi:hypothetical protein